MPVHYCTFVSPPERLHPTKTRIVAHNQPRIHVGTPTQCHASMPHHQPAKPIVPPSTTSSTITIIRPIERTHTHNLIKTLTTRPLLLSLWSSPLYSCLLFSHSQNAKKPQIVNTPHSHAPASHSCPTPPPPGPTTVINIATHICPLVFPPFQFHATTPVHIIPATSTTPHAQNFISPSLQYA